MSKTAKAIKACVDETGEFLTTTGLCFHLKIARSAVIDGMDELKAKFPKRYMRIRAYEGGGIGPF